MLEPSDSDLLKENLLAIIEGLDTGIIAHDLKRRIIYFNRAAEEITGYKRSEVLGKDCHTVFIEPFCGSRCHFLEGDPMELPKRPYDVTILTKGGRPKRVRMSVTPIGRGGSLTGVVASFSDITENLIAEGLGEKGIQFHGIVTRDPAMLQLIGKIREIAGFDYPVYIFGETGTGKELVANAIHQESRRAGGPFVTVNCAAIPETLLESEFFGYEKGAFTGAFRSRKGRFELAHKGTIFLDEVGELSKSTQAKLLRVVETMELTRLGAEAPTKVDVRILVATNRDLREEVRKGRFREDLFYRLSGLTLRLPPLRERPDDVPLLLEHFGSRMRQEGFGEKVFSKEAMERLMKYKWPGNVRELQSVLRYSYIHSEDSIIRPKDLPNEIFPANSKGSLEEEAIAQALQRAGGNRTKAAKLLGISRATFYRHLKGRKLVS